MAGSRIQINEYLSQLAREGYLELRVKGKKEGAVVYNGTFLPAMEKLCFQHGLATIASHETGLLSVLSGVSVANGPVRDLVQETIDSLRAGDGYRSRLFGDDYKDLPDILAGADAVIRNTKETYIRDLSKKIYNDSKRMAAIRPGIEKFVKECSNEDILREYRVMSDAGLTKSVFPLYGVMPQPYAILFEADARLKTDKGPVCTYGYPFPIMSTMADTYEEIILLDDALVTIENRTTYDDYHVTGQGKFFTGGFPGFAEKKLLSKIYSDNPEKKYYHWGDIDVGGFRIFHDIRKQIPSVKPLHMDPETLLYYEKSGLATPLTAKDRESLQDIKGDRYFSDTIDIMLKKNIKMEQEAFYIPKGQ